MNELNVIQQIAVLALPVLFAITAHEAAHGFAAQRLGDSTAYMMGRVTFNPLKHIDPVGTILVPAATFLLSGFLFGWAKPVPVNFDGLRRPRRDMALVALAGPGANLVMALFWALMMRFGFGFEQTLPWAAQPLIYMAYAGILINAILLVLNLLPILPLDGGRVVAALLPPRLEAGYAQMEPWGLVIILVLLFTGLLQVIVGPGVQLVQLVGYLVAGLG